MFKNNVRVVCKCKSCPKYSPKADQYCSSCLSNFCDDADEIGLTHE